MEDGRRVRSLSTRGREAAGAQRRGEGRRWHRYGRYAALLGGWRIIGVVRGVTDDVLALVPVLALALARVLPKIEEWGKDEEAASEAGEEWSSKCASARKPMHSAGVGARAREAKRHKEER